MNGIALHIEIARVTKISEFEKTSIIIYWAFTKIPLLIILLNRVSRVYELNVKYEECQIGTGTP